MSSLIRILLLLLCSFPMYVTAQKKFAATSVDQRSARSLTAAFRQYSVYRINVRDIKQHLAAGRAADVLIQLELPGMPAWNLSLKENDIVSPEYTLTINSRTGRSVLPKPACMTYSGTVNGNDVVRLTITEDLIYGLVRTGNTEYFIEPLWYFDKNAPRDLFVVYDARNVIFDPNTKCGSIEMKRQQDEMSGLTARPGNCGLVELAIASDNSMVTKYGTALDVQTHNIGVMNNVQVDYSNNQTVNDVQFVIVTQNVSASPATDQTLPLYAGTNSGTILSSFRSWGQAGNFGVTYDIASLWTNRNIDEDGAGTNSGIVGLAYVGVVCGTSRYNLLQDYAGTLPTGSGYQLRVLTSHEIGHNFSANHDAAGSGFIMAPSINNTSTWSPASVTSIDNHVDTRTCLGDCFTAGDCAVITGLTNSGNTTSSVTLSWDAKPGNNTYDVEYKAATSSTWITAAAGISATTKNITGLNQATLYNWRVRPYCSSGFGTWSNASFATSSTATVCIGCYQNTQRP